MRLFKSANLSHSRFSAFAAVCAVLLLGACSAAPKIPDVPIIPTGADTSATVESAVVPASSFAGRAPADRVVYFDYDATEVQPDYLSVVTEHGRFLAANPDSKVRLEGHTDERGTREYNIGLGEGRSQSVGTMLQLQGANSGQMSVISFGEELPAASGQSESAWSQNRRVSIIYTN